MRVFWVVGESSGDRHAAGLIEALGKLRPEWVHTGMGGKAMRRAGCATVADLSEAALMGLTEVIRHLPRMIRLRERLLDEIARVCPGLVILVDFPDFNLALLRKLRRRFGRSIKVLYYVSPQVWAWRKGRARTMAKQLDAMAVLFPFEVDLYRKYGLETIFFGHPFTGSVRPSAPISDIGVRFNLENNAEAITLMPGSRVHEVERHLPIQLETVELLRKNHPELIALVVRAETVPVAAIERFTAGRNRVQVVEGSAADALAVSRVGLIKSGTSTVEAALAAAEMKGNGTPFVVMYRVSPLTFFLAKLLVRGVRHIAMINVLADRELVPEHIQNDATPEHLATDLERLWKGTEREKTLAGLREVAESLGEPGGTERLAAWIVKRFGENT